MQRLIVQPYAWKDNYLHKASIKAETTSREDHFFSIHSLKELEVFYLQLAILKEKKCHKSNHIDLQGYTRIYNDRLMDSSDPALGEINCMGILNVLTFQD